MYKLCPWQLVSFIISFLLLFRRFKRIRLVKTFKRGCHAKGEQHRNSTKNTVSLLYISGIFSVFILETGSPFPLFFPLLQFDCCWSLVVFLSFSVLGDAVVVPSMPNKYVWEVKSCCLENSTYLYMNWSDFTDKCWLRCILDFTSKGP